MTRSYLGIDPGADGAAVRILGDHHVEGIVFDGRPQAQIASWINLMDDNTVCVIESSLTYGTAGAISLSR